MFFSLFFFMYVVCICECVHVWCVCVCVCVCVYVCEYISLHEWRTALESLTCPQIYDFLLFSTFTIEAPIQTWDSLQCCKQLHMQTTFKWRATSSCQYIYTYSVGGWNGEVPLISIVASVLTADGPFHWASITNASQGIPQHFWWLSIK